VSGASPAEIDEEAADLRDEIVARGAGDWPVAQALVRRQYLLDDDVELALGYPGRLGRFALQALAIAPRIEQPVDVIDAQAVEPALRDERQHAVMGAREEFRQLHADAGEIVDVEEPAIVDLVRGGPPIGRAPGLRLEKRMEAAPARRLARLAHQACRRLLDRRRAPRGRGSRVLRAPP